MKMLFSQAQGLQRLIHLANTEVQPHTVPGATSRLLPGLPLVCGVSVCCPASHSVVVQQNPTYSNSSLPAAHFIKLTFTF